MHHLLQDIAVLLLLCVWCAGFWSILVLSVLAGIVCCASSWTLTYLDLYQPGTVFSAMTQAQSRLTHSCIYHRALMGISYFLYNCVSSCVSALV